MENNIRLHIRIHIRIAWYDKQINKYDYGNWHHFSTLDYKQRWVEEQNKKDPYVRYWIEGCKYISDKKNIEKSNLFFSNIETFNVIKMECQNEFLLL